MSSQHNPHLFSVSKLPGPLRAIAEAAPGAVPGVDGAGVTVRQDGLDLRAGSNAFASAVDDLQYQIGQGPCIDAVREGATVVMRTTDPEGRWPDFAPGARQLGVRSVLSVPLRLRSQTVGSLNLYSRNPDRFDTPTIARGQQFARPAALMLANLGTVNHAADAADAMRLALQDRTVTAVAVGVLIGTETGLSTAAAHTRLVQIAAERGVPVLSLARQIAADPQGWPQA